MAGDGKRSLERLAQVIFWTRSFTEDELTRSYQRFQTGSSEGQLVTSMGDHLERLRGLGVLGFEGGRYFLLKSGGRAV
jgi:hypothetical protein